jgi:hypothetical protein
MCFYIDNVVETLPYLPYVWTWFGRHLLFHVLVDSFKNIAHKHHVVMSLSPGFGSESFNLLLTSLKFVFMVVLRMAVIKFVFMFLYLSLRVILFIWTLISGSCLRLDVVYVSFELQFHFFKISMHHAWWFALSLLSLVIVVCIFYSKVNTKSRQTGMQQSVEARN